MRLFRKLGSIVTIVQAMGTQKMAKEHAVIKNLKAVESLGCVSVICSDKTGTLTQNRLRTEAVFLNGEEVPVRQLKKHENFLFLETAVLANNAWGGLPEETSDPLEQALLEMTKEAGEEPEMIRKGWKRLLELPFDSKKKVYGDTLYKGKRTGSIRKRSSRCIIAPDVLMWSIRFFRKAQAGKCRRHFLGAAHVIFRQKPNFAAKCSLGKKRYACPCTCMQTIR